MASTSQEFKERGKWERHYQNTYITYSCYKKKGKEKKRKEKKEEKVREREREREEEMRGTGYIWKRRGG